MRNNITAQTFRFSCGRWFGRSVEDGALERLLVAEVVPTGDGSVEDMNAGGNFGFNGGFISRPESPVSGILTSQKPTTSFYSTASLARRRRSPSVGRTMEALTRQAGQRSAHRFLACQSLRICNGPTFRLIHWRAAEGAWRRCERVGEVLPVREGLQERRTAHSVALR